MACIYKITNTINGKVYIGYTSRDVKTRFKEHFINAKHNNKKRKEKLTYIQKAIIKYGKKSFVIESLYDLPNNKQEVWGKFEQYYINKYKSNNKKNGYNLTKGGETPPQTFGENNVMARLTDEQFYEIVEMIKSKDITFTNISNMYNVSNSTIERINSGSIRFQDNIDYPIRKHNIYERKSEKVVKLLINTNLKYSSIENVVGINHALISDINLGKNKRYIFENLKYPIRENAEYNKLFYYMDNYACLSCYKLQVQDAIENEIRAFNICKELITTINTHKIIASKYDVDISLISKINKGVFHKQFLNIFTFPIRDNAKENQKILDKLEAVETIPLIGK